MKEKREIVRIDEELCDGCGLCVPACAERAIEIIDGKARLIDESFCDGLGACLGDCPRGAITIEVREAEPFDEEAVEEFIAQQESRKKSSSCASSCEKFIGKEDHEREEVKKSSSALRHWPIQLHLISPDSKFLEHSHWLIAADCVPFAYADFHQKFLKGKTLLMGCPKLDDIWAYDEKLTEMLKKHRPESITILVMEVPCCTGLIRLVSKLIEESGHMIKKEVIVIDLKGNVKSHVSS